MTTAADLRDAYDRSGLWRQGWSYEQAIKDPLILKALETQARATRRLAERRQQPQPEQLGLV